MAKDEKSKSVAMQKRNSIVNLEEVKLETNVGEMTKLVDQGDGTFKMVKVDPTEEFKSALNLTNWGLLTNVLAHMGAYGLWPVYYLVTPREDITNWTVFLCGFVLVPLLDVFLGEDLYNLTKKQEMQWRKHIGFRVVTWFHTPLQFLGLMYTCWFVSNNELSWFEYVGLVMSCGTICGFGIGCVHEMIHRPEKLDWFLAVISLVFSGHSHFWIEHLWGHHHNVATELDCASSDLGDAAWWWVPRCLLYSFIEACHIESKLMKRQNGRNWYHPTNRIFMGWLATAVFWYAIHEVFGMHAMLTVIGIGFWTAWLVDNTNYIEHYGLRRRKDEKGEHEVVWWFHSWDTPAVLTNTLLFKIQRHPDHHTNAGRPYQILRTYKFAPQLPTGYAGCIVLSWFPFLWRMVMDHRVELAKYMRDEYEREGTINNMDFIFPKERRAVHSYDHQADAIIMEKEAHWNVNTLGEDIPSEMDQKQKAA